MGYSPWGCKEPDITKQLTLNFTLHISYTSRVTIYSLVTVLSQF